SPAFIGACDSQNGPAACRAARFFGTPSEIDSGAVGGPSWTREALMPIVSDKAQDGFSATSFDMLGTSDAIIDRAPRTLRRPAKSFRQSSVLWCSHPSELLSSASR